MTQKHDISALNASIESFLKKGQGVEIERICQPLEKLISKKEEYSRKTDKDWLKKQIEDEIQIIEVFASEIDLLIRYQNRYLSNYLSVVVDLLQQVEFYKCIAEDFTFHYHNKNIDPVLKSNMLKSSAVSLYQKTHIELKEAKAKIKKLEQQSKTTI